MSTRALKNSRISGFTLIEMIAVIIILGVLAALGGQFVVESSKSYESTRTRAKLVNTGRQAVERMSRQLRIALPYSLRVTNNGACLEFMPIASGGVYIASVPDINNGAPAQSAIDVSPFTIEFGTARYASIGAMSAAELYGASTASLASLAAPLSITTPVAFQFQVNLGTSKIWQRNSINQRFYLLDSPQAFCIVGNQLRFYANQALNNPTNLEVNLSSAYSLLAENVTASSPFSLSSGSENRNMNVNFNITFTKGGAGTESLTFNQSVMIRNVP